MGDSVDKTNQIQCCHGPAAGFAAVDAGIQHWQLDVAQRVDPSDQVERLENKTDLSVADHRQTVGIH
jgi:hypothetical protein